MDNVKKICSYDDILWKYLYSETINAVAIYLARESFVEVECIIEKINNINFNRKSKLRIILIGNCEVSVQISARICGYTFVQTKYSTSNRKLNIVKEYIYSKKNNAIRCYAEKLDQYKLLFELEDVGIIIADDISAIDIDSDIIKIPIQYFRNNKNHAID